MNRAFSSIILVAVFLISPFTSWASSKTNDKDVEIVIHLLSYISRDYPAGVQNGKIINEQEYSEMLEFSRQVYQLTKDGKFLSKKDSWLIDDMQKLRSLIKNKRPAEDVYELSQNLKNEIIKVTGVQTAPKDWPDAKKGKTLFLQNCVSCHGIKGNGQGKLAKNLDPTPANFLDDGLMRQVSPFQAYNTIKLGVQGTSMQGFSEFDEKQLWDLAFYIKALRFQEKATDTTSLRKQFEKAFPEITLKDVATLSDEELLIKLAKNTDNSTTRLEALRILAPTGDNSKTSLSIAKNNLNIALKNYTEGNKSLARNNALSAYLEGIEPVEARLRANDPSFVIKLEQQMLNVRQAIEKDKGTHVLKEETNKALDLIAQADEVLKDQNLNYWLSFIFAASIMLREGLEAFLILAVVLALIRSSGVKKALPWLHGGWITAVIMGVGGWFLSDYIIQFGGKNREIMEGLVSLLAVVVLLFVGFWLHNHSHAKKWKKFVEEKIGGYLQKDKMFGLAVFSFMVVFREAFEVILFLQAISLEAKAENQSAIGLGVLTAVGCIALFAYLFLKYSKKIPVRQLFKYSSWIIVLLAVILLGKGIHSIQESGWIPITGLSSIFRIDWLGFYPTLETIAAQFALLIIIFITYLVSNQRAKKMILK